MQETKKEQSTICKIKICRQIICKNNVHQVTESYPSVEASRHLVVVEVTVHVKAYKTLGERIDGVLTGDVLEHACEELAL